MVIPAESTEPPTEAASGPDDVAYLAEVVSEVVSEGDRERSDPGTSRPKVEQMDELFRSGSPEASAAGGTPLREALRRVERTAYLETSDITASKYLGSGFFKRNGAKAVLKGVRLMTAPMARYSTASVRLFEDVVDRIEELSERLDQPPVPGVQALMEPAVEVMDAWWGSEALDFMTQVHGPVWHMASGDGSLVEALRAKGVSSDGLQPRDDLTTFDPARSLAEMEPGSLGGIVLSGSATWLQPATRARYLEMITTRLAPKGRLAVHSPTPETWSATVSYVMSDLVPSRPLHSETWVLLLTEAGFKITGLSVSGGERRLGHVSGANPDADVLNAAIDAINVMSPGTGEYFLTAERDNSGG
jgi:hypothetical protein